MKKLNVIPLLENPLFTGVNPRKPPHQFWTNLFQRLGGAKMGAYGGKAPVWSKRGAYGTGFNAAPFGRRLSLGNPRGGFLKVGWRKRGVNGGFAPVL